MSIEISSTGATDGDQYDEFLQCLLAGDRGRCRAVFESWLAANDLVLRALYQDRLQPALYRVGELWEQGRVSVATEHLATAIVEGLLAMVYPRLFERPGSGRSAVIACAPHEFHRIGGKMVADLFELNGWRGWFLGAKTREGELLELIQQKSPDALVLSLTVHFNLDALLRTAAAVRSDCPDLPILVGGQGFRWGGLERVAEVPGAQHLESLQALEAWIAAHSDHDG